MSLHGHGGTPYSMRDDFFTKQLIQAGYIVIAPFVRQMDRPNSEADLQGILKPHGIKILGLRLFEMKLLLKYLDESYDPKIPIGILGHSGGSTLARLLINVDQRISVLVMDYSTSWSGSEHICNSILEFDGFDFHNTSTKVFEFSYGYKNKASEIVQTFIKNL